MDLVRPHFGKNHHVTMDNWFTSPKLLTDLRNRGTYGTGTVIVRRKGLPPSFRTTRLPKGSVVVKSQRELLAILYSDRKHVTFLTTYDNARYVENNNYYKILFFDACHKINTISTCSIMSIIVYIIVTLNNNVTLIKILLFVRFDRLYISLIFYDANLEDFK